MPFCLRYNKLESNEYQFRGHGLSPWLCFYDFGILWFRRLLNYFKIAGVYRLKNKILSIYQSFLFFSIVNYYQICEFLLTEPSTEFLQLYAKFSPSRRSHPKQPVVVGNVIHHEPIQWLRDLIDWKIPILLQLFNQKLH